MTGPTAPALKNYETLSALTRDLREAAVLGEWDRLTEIQRQRTALVQSMPAIDATTTLDASDLRRKDELISQILADETETRNLVKSWMTQLEKAMQEGRQELRLLKEYRKYAG